MVQLIVLVTCKPATSEEEICKKFVLVCKCVKDVCEAVVRRLQSTFVFFPRQHELENIINTYKRMGISCLCWSSWWYPYTNHRSNTEPCWLCKQKRISFCCYAGCCWLQLPLRGIEFSWQKISQLFGVSGWIVYRRVQLYGLQNIQQFSLLTDPEIDEIVAEYLSRHAFTTGRTYIASHLRSLGLQVQRRRVRESLTRVEG